MSGHGTRRGAAPSPATTATAPPPPAVDTPAHIRRIYNVVDPSALARIYAAAIECGHTTASARECVNDFLKLMREPYDD